MAHALFAVIAALGLSAQDNKIATSAGDAVVHPVSHATFVLEWNGKTIYVDPVGGGGKFGKFPKPDLILVTDIHGDHLNAGTLEAVSTANTTIIAPAAVASKIPGSVKGRKVVLANGRTAEAIGATVQAIPMYNLTPERKRFHSKGRGNGYVVTLGGKRFYISGDTEDIPEMRALKNIDAAFVCMNLPYTMAVDRAADAVLAFKPKVVFPYHYRGKGGLSDVGKFKSLVSKDPAIRVRQLNWYP